MKILAVWLLICAIWGSTWFFIKLGLQDLPPFSFAGIRFILAFAVIAFVIKIKKIPLPGSFRDWMLIAGTGFLTFGINYGLIFWGEQFVSSGLAAVLNATMPAFGMILAPLYLREKVTPLKVAAMVLGLTGVAVIFFEQLQISDWAGFGGGLGIVAGAAVGAYSSVLVKAFGSHLNPATLTAGQTFCGLLPLCLIGLATEGNLFGFNWTAGAIISVIYLALFGTVAGFWLYYWLLRQIAATKALLIGLIIPIVAVLVGVIFLDETMGWRKFTGVFLVLFSVGLILFPQGQSGKEFFSRIKTHFARKQMSEG